MARDLFVIRHAKSDWSFDVDDFGRPLNQRGFENAPRMGARLASYAVQPGLLVSSPANRAITTAQLFAGQLQIPVSEIRTDHRLYEALPLTLLKVVNELDNGQGRVALFGHNPSLSAFVSYMTGDEFGNLPTSGIVHLQFDDIDDWGMVSGGTGRVAWFVYPKDGE